MDISIIAEWGNHLGTFIGMSASLIALYKVRQNKKISTKIRQDQKDRYAKMDKKERKVCKQVIKYLGLKEGHINHFNTLEELMKDLVKRGKK